MTYFVAVHIPNTIDGDDSAFSYAVIEGHGGEAAGKVGAYLGEYSPVENMDTDTFTDMVATIKNLHVRETFEYMVHADEYYQDDYIMVVHRTK